MLDALLDMRHARHVPTQVDRCGACAGDDDIPSPHGPSGQITRFVWRRPKGIEQWNCRVPARKHREGRAVG